EEEQAFQNEQKQLYTEALAGCLKDKNMKKCNDEIAFDDFKQDKEDVPIWMPLTLMMK
ncbi:MAG: hypothetical protein H2B05_04740, partial [Nitrosopumilaceae archaeon]|nr:hypothetical protein [Nitrosopumilaceae archaeon]